MEKRIEGLERQISDERAHLSTDRMDVSFGELLNMYKAGELIIRPEYQRLVIMYSAMKETRLFRHIMKDYDRCGTKYYQI